MTYVGRGATNCAIHRDVKPPNLVLRQVSGEDHTYLTDFGVAKPLYAEEKFTKSGFTVGTIGYMAPEQIQGLEPMPQTDLYALGCLVFRLLTGSAPFRADNELALAWAHLHDPRPASSTSVPELGTRYDDFIAMALAIEPTHRFSSGRAFATALKAVHAEPARSLTPGATGVDTHVPEPTLIDPLTAPRTPADPSHKREPTALYPPYAQAGPPSSSPPTRHRGRRFALALLTIIALGGIAAGALAASGAFTNSTPTTINGLVSTDSVTSSSTVSSTTASSRSTHALPHAVGLPRP